MPIYSITNIAFFALFFFLGGATFHGAKDRPYDFITEKYLASVDSLIFLERTRCYGWCPSYRLCFQSDGTILFEGSAYTENLGLHKGQGTHEQFLALSEKLASLGIFSLRNRYGRMDPDCKESFLDAPSATVLIKLGDQSKRVSHYFGCRGFPAESDLTNIEREIDNSTKSERWVGAK